MTSQEIPEWKGLRVTVVGERKMAVYNDLSDNERIRVYDIGVDAAVKRGVGACGHGRLRA